MQSLDSGCSLVESSETAMAVDWYSLGHPLLGKCLCSLVDSSLWHQCTFGRLSDSGFWILLCP